MENIKIIGAVFSDYDDYYSIRCDKSDIYWMGHKGKPDYNFLKTIFLERIDAVNLHIIGSKKIFMIKYFSCSIGFAMLSHNIDGIEVGISIKSEYHGHGYGTQAYKDTMKIAKTYSNDIYSRIRDDNIVSQKMVINNGLSRTDEYEEVEYPIAGKIKFRKYLLK